MSFGPLAPIEVSKAKKAQNFFKDVESHLQNVNSHNAYIEGMRFGMQ